jgi:hypothetical protein
MGILPHHEATHDGALDEHLHGRSGRRIAAAEEAENPENEKDRKDEA